MAEKERYERRAARFGQSGKAVVLTRVAQTLASNGAVAIDASAGNSHAVTLQANATSTTISNASTGQELVITYIQDSTGGRTYVWPTNCKFAAATAPSDTTLSTRTSVTFIYDGTNWNETARAVAVA